MDVLSKETAGTAGKAKAFENGSRVFVSGSAGFIGSRLSHRLLKEGAVERVVVFDNFTSGQHSYLDGLINDRRPEVIEDDPKRPQCCQVGDGGLRYRVSSG